MGTDGAAFVRVLGGCTAPALAKILEAYESRYGKPLVERLRTEFVFDPDLRKLVVTRCKWARAATAKPAAGAPAVAAAAAAAPAVSALRRADDGQVLIVGVRISEAVGIGEPTAAELAASLAAQLRDSWSALHRGALGKHVNTDVPLPQQPPAAADHRTTFSSRPSCPSGSGLAGRRVPAA